MTDHNRHDAGAKQAGRSMGGKFAPTVQTEASGIGLLDAPEPHRLAQRFDSMDEKIAAMTEEISVEVERLKEDVEWNRYLDQMSKFHHYSLGNQLLIWSQFPDATRVGGKTLWESLGRKVKPYAERDPEHRHGIAILRPNVRYADKLDANGNPLTDENGKKIRQRYVAGFGTATIYDISQTNGEPLADGGDRALTETPPPGFEEDLRSAISGLGYSYSEEPMFGSELGFTTIDGSKRVVVQKGLPEAERVRVIAHELGHIAAGHTERGDEYHTGHGGQRGAMEIEADSITHVMLRMNGMDPTHSTGRYAAGWALVQSDDPDGVKKSAAAVQVAVKSLLEGNDWKNVELPERPEYVPRPRKRSGGRPKTRTTSRRRAGGGMGSADSHAS